jgi:MFS family permease
LRAGWRYLRGDRLLLALALTIALTNALDTPFGSLILPFYAQGTLGSSVALGLLLAAGGGGSLAGALLYAIWGAHLPRRPLFLLAFAVSAIPFLLLAVTPPLSLLLLARFVGGLAAGPINPLIDTLKQERVPLALRGRVFGLITAIAWAAIPLGLLASGALLDRLGLRATVLLLGGAYLATVVAMALLPALRDLRSPGSAPARPSGGELA